MAEEPLDRLDWRLLPSEQVLWHGRPQRVPQARQFLYIPWLLVAYGVVSILFGGVLYALALPGVLASVGVGVHLWLFAGGLMALPRVLLRRAEYVVTDRRVIFRRGALRRTMDVAGIAYARIKWHHSVPGVGSLELVRAVPFGPLQRTQRLSLLHIEAPDAVYALMRGVKPAQFSGDAEISFVERLDPDERILWGGGPDGWHLGWRNAVSALLGVFSLALAVAYVVRIARVLGELERDGMTAGSVAWVLFLAAVLLTGTMLLAIGVGMLHAALVKARALGQQTEYLLTNSRLLIRRGRIELSVDRRRIVDVAEAPANSGTHHLYLVLDAPHSKALADSGALAVLSPPAAQVPPVLYELRDVDDFKRLLMEAPTEEPPADQVPDAA